MGWLGFFSYVLGLRFYNTTMVISNWVSFQNFYFFLLLVCYVVLYFRQSNYM